MQKPDSTTIPQPGSYSFLPPADASQPQCDALRHRAHTGMLFNVLLQSERPQQFDFWQGYAKAAADMAKGTATRLALKDASLGGYETPRSLTAAAGCLGDDIYRLTRTQVVERLASAGFKVPADPLADGDVIPAQQFKDGAIAPLDLNDEHPAQAVVVSDGANRHDASHVDAAIVAQGGAA